jgi:hypothetical protein
VIHGERSTSSSVNSHDILNTQIVAKLDFFEYCLTSPHSQNGYGLGG